MNRNGPFPSIPSMRRLPLLLLIALAALAVSLSVGSPTNAADGKALGKPTGLRVATEQGSLAVGLDWNDVDGAVRYQVRWREAGPGNKLNSGVTTTTSQLGISVGSYGEWVARVQACNDAGCGSPLSRKFRVKPAPGSTPEPTPTPTPAPAPTPTPEPAPKPKSTPTPPPTPTPTPEPPELRVTISASPASPQVNQYATLSATIYNIPFDSGRPTYDWQMQRDGGWNSVWNGPTFSYSTNSPTSIAFRLAVSYESGISDTSEPLTVTWTGECELAPPEDVSALGVARAAVAFWQAPSDDDACEPAGYLVGARSLDGGEWVEETAPPEARSHVLDDLTPGQVEYHVTTIYPTGISDRPLALPQIAVPAACDITLTVAADVDSGISGTWTNVAGAPTGCVFGPEIEFQFKQSTWDHFRSYGRYPNSQQSEDSFIAYDLRPGVSYDFKIAAVDAAGRKNESNVASATVAYDADAADDHSPLNVRVVPHNRGNAYVTWEDSPTAPSRQTLTRFVVEWKTPGGTAMTKDVAATAPKETEITGLTDGSVYLVRVAARRTDASSTIYHAWSGPTAPFTARSEPTRLWFFGNTPRLVGSVGSVRLFLRVDRNTPAGFTICRLTVGSSSQRDINCPLGTLSHTGGNGAISVHGRDTHEDGTVTLTSVSESDEFGASPVSDSFASGGNGTLFIGWDVDEVRIPADIGTHDAWVVQHRKQNADETWPAWPTGHVITDTTARSHTFTGLANGTWQVRVRARTANTEDHDDDAITPDQTVHRLGFTSEIHTVTVDSTYTDTPGTPAGARVTPGRRPLSDVDNEAPGVGTLVVEWEPPTGGGSEVYAYQVRHRRGDYAFGDGGGDWTRSPRLYPRQVERICRYGRPGTLEWRACLPEPQELHDLQPDRRTRLRRGDPGQERQRLGRLAAGRRVQPAQRLPARAAARGDRRGDHVVDIRPQPGHRFVALHQRVLGERERHEPDAHRAQHLRQHVVCHAGHGGHQRPDGHGQLHQADPDAAPAQRRPGAELLERVRPQLHAVGGRAAIVPGT